MIRRFGPAVALLLLAAAVTLTPLASNDLWVHLAAGRETMRSLETGGGIPAEERFSWTAEGRPLVPHEWLSELIFHAAWQAGGAKGILALRLMCVLAILAGLKHAAARAGVSPAAIAAALALLLLAAAPRLLERPHLLGWVAAAWLLALLAAPLCDSANPSWLRSLGIAVLLALWVNLHGGFIIGAALAAGAVAAALAASPRLPFGVPLRVAGAAALGLAAGALVHPSGWRIFTFPATLAGSEIVNDRILEWRSPFETTYWSTIPFILTGVIALVTAAGAVTSVDRPGSLLRARRAWPVLGVLVWLGFGFPALLHIRSAADFAILLSPWTAGAIEALATPTLITGTAVSAISAVAAVLIARFGYPVRLDQRVLPIPPLIAPATPAAAAEFIAGLPGLPAEARLFNSYTLGGYLEWRLYPSARVLIDSRNEAYGDELTERILSSFRSASAFGAQIVSTQPDLVVLAWRQLGEPAILSSLAADPAWKLVFLDDYTAVWARAASTASALQFAAPGQFDPRRITPDSAEAAVSEGTRLLGWQPRGVMGTLVFSWGLMVQGRNKEARAALEATAEEEPDSPALWSTLAQARSRTGDSAGAVEASNKAASLARQDTR